MSTNRLEVESCEIFSLDQIGGLTETARLRHAEKKVKTQRQRVERYALNVQLSQEDFWLILRSQTLTVTHKYFTYLQ